MLRIRNRCEKRANRIVLLISKTIVTNNRATKPINTKPILVTIGNEQNRVKTIVTTLIKSANIALIFFTVDKLLIIQGVGVSDEFDGANWWRGGLGFASDLARF